jgi:hypothetical protein
VLFYGEHISLRVRFSSYLVDFKLFSVFALKNTAVKGCGEKRCRRSTAPKCYAQIPLRERPRSWPSATNPTPPKEGKEEIPRRFPGNRNRRGIECKQSNFKEQRPSTEHLFTIRGKIKRQTSWRIIAEAFSDLMRRGRRNASYEKAGQFYNPAWWITASQDGDRGC